MQKYLQQNSHPDLHFSDNAIQGFIIRAIFTYIYTFIITGLLISALCDIIYGININVVRTVHIGSKCTFWLLFNSQSH